MSTTLSVRLADDLARFNERQVSEGHYQDADAVMRAGLHMLEEREAKLVALNAALDEGLASGISDRTFEEIWAEAIEEAARS